MRAMRLTESPEGLVLMPVDLPQPEPAGGQILVHVEAAGVTPTELAWFPTTHNRDGSVRRGAVPGHAFSGVVAELGDRVDSFEIGDAVFGMNDWFADGATAEFCVAEPVGVARKPSSLSHEEAATVPIGALTAWQGLFSRARLKAGERVLVHGGAGAVGLFAVQLASQYGAHVFATASADTIDFVNSLGATDVIDYRASRLEARFNNIDVVFDTVGGNTREKSWGVLGPNGRLVTIASDAEGSTDEKVKRTFFIVESNAIQLQEIGRRFDTGLLKTFVKASVPLNEAPAAYMGDLRGRSPGKTVVTIED